MSSDVKCEVCVESLVGALAAESGGADRIELCANLVLGGTTPSLGLIQLVTASIALPCMVMIRLRSGDFCYERHELDVMIRDIELAKQAGAGGVVFGTLRKDRSIDHDAVRELVDSAQPLSVTFHRAFDLAADPHEALETLIELGCDRVLTSGQQPAAEQGIALLADLVERAAERIIVMPGAGVHERNAPRILRETRAKEIHFSARRQSEPSQTIENARIEISQADVGARWETSQRRVASICSAVRER